VGRLVIETNKETGLDEVELTLDNGKVWRFKGKGESELRLIPGHTEQVDISTVGNDGQSVPGRRIPDTFAFEVDIRDIANVEITEPGGEPETL
jgi:hypothetical protein